MTGGRAMILWIAVALVAAAAWATWGVGAYFSAVDDARAAVADVAEAEAFAAQIRAARGATTTARPSAESQAVDLTETLNAAMRDAKIDADHLASVAPGDARAVPGSRLVDRRTQVALRGVTLAQATTLTRSLESAGGGVSVRDLRLVAPANADADLWDLELGLSRLTLGADRVQSVNGT